MNYRHIWGAGAVGLAAILWGLDGIVLTPRLGNLDVGLVVLILHLIPFLLMNLFLFKSYHALKQFTVSDLISFVLVALMGGALGTLAIVKALFLVNFEQLSMVVLLQKMQPVFAVIMALIILKERVRKQFYIWAVIAVISSYFLTFGFSFPGYIHGSATLQAALLSLFAALAFASSTVFSKKVLHKYSFHTGTFFRYGFTTLIMILYFLSFGKWDAVHAITPNNWMIFLIIAFTTGSGAIFLYYWGLKKIRAVIATFAELMFPISAILFDYFINDNVLSDVQWIAASVLLFSIIMISNLKSPETKV